MAIQKCPACGKFYDTNINQTCPYCSNSFVQFNNVDMADQNAKTVPLDFSDLDSGSDDKTVGMYDEIDEHDKTIGLFFQENDYNPVTAWIVCIEGTVRGKSYEVHLNRNFIGRNKLMDIAIPDDLQICRENHLSITYDNKSNRFFAKSEKGSLLINGKLIDSAVEIFENDILEFGESKYVFVPYCKKERVWNEE